MPDPDIKLEPYILELLASRICHDLISPVSAVENGVEFINDMGADSTADAMDLISTSASTAAARIQTFRLIYGSGGNDKGIEPKNVHKTLEDLMAVDGKVTQEWDPHGELGIDPGSRGFCKIIGGMAVLALECLPRGGQISITAGKPGQTLVNAEGPDILLRPQITDILSGSFPSEDLDPRLVHSFVVNLFARHYGFTIALEDISEKRMSLSLSQI